MRRPASSVGLRSAALALALLVGGCGYRLATSRNAVLESQGIRTVYVAPVRNDSFKSGAENVVYNEVLRMLASTRTLRMVNRPEDADVILRGTVIDASYVASSQTGADTLSKGLAGISEAERATLNGRPIAAQYLASLGVAFRLERPPAGPSAPLTGGAAPSPVVVFARDFRRQRPFPSNNQLRAYGTTAALLNDSEFDRALRENAAALSFDLFESMLAVF